MKLPSKKLQISKPFTISDSVVNFVYDITVVKAVQSGKYILKPWIDQSGPDQDFNDVIPTGKPEKSGKPDKPGKPDDELQLHLLGDEPGLGMEVTLIVTDGESPVEGATVTVNGEEVEAKTDSDGLLTIALPDTPGEVKIEATFEGKSGELEIELEAQGE